MLATLQHIQHGSDCLSQQASYKQRKDTWSQNLPENSCCGSGGGLDLGCHLPMLLWSLVRTPDLEFAMWLARFEECKSGTGT